MRNSTALITGNNHIFEIESYNSLWYFLYDFDIYTVKIKTLKNGIHKTDIQIPFFKELKGFQDIWIGIYCLKKVNSTTLDIARKPFYVVNSPPM